MEETQLCHITSCLSRHVRSVPQRCPHLAEQRHSTRRLAERPVIGLIPGRDVYRKLQGRDFLPSSAILSIKGSSVRSSHLLEAHRPVNSAQRGLSVSTHTEADRQLLSKREQEERRVAQMGRPALGEHGKLEVIIEESYQFKVRGRGPGLHR